MIIDTHSHVLPDLDDGPKTIEESLLTLREACRQGLDGMIVTPHYHPGRYMVRADAVWAALEKVRECAVRDALPLTLFPGQECYYHRGLVKALEAGEVLTLGGSRFVLVEFDPSVPYSDIQYAIRDLTASGYRPVVAHFERYQCLYGQRKRLGELRESGAMLQMNYDRLLERGGFLRPNPWKGLLKGGYVDFLGSDTHGMSFRPLNAGPALSWLRSAVSAEQFMRITSENPRILIGDERESLWKMEK